MLNREEIETWVMREPESERLEYGEEFDHVVHCLHNICLWYERGLPVGDFLTAVLKNNFMEACGRADNVNAKVLTLYAKFIYNHLPLDYKQKIGGKR